ncbi:DsbA family protein [Psychrobacillus sp.]|uniref:DsbA family protein n=1 Tax=Psychrobacillus sp. TaxID=1871623 RepID=UPI0037CBBDA1
MNKNPMMCDLETGICGPAEEDNTGLELIDLSAPRKKMNLYYATDPICSHCWALEPVLRRFTEQYGHYFNMHTLMGGLVEKWDDFDDTSGISKPSDVAKHWKEIGLHSRMPINGDLWFDNHVTSSYIPSRVYKVIQQKDAKLAVVFLRKAREAVLPFNKNIGSDHILIDLVNKIGLNGEEIVKESYLPAAQELLQEDFTTLSHLDVRGFPTLVFINEEQKGVKVVGVKSFESYIEALQQLLPDEKIQPANSPNLQSLLQKEELLFSKEIEEMYRVEEKNVEAFIQKELAGHSYAVEEILGEKYIKALI